MRQVDVEALLPRPRTPRHYRELAADPRTGEDALRALAGTPYSFVTLAVAGNPATPPDTLTWLTGVDLDRFDRNLLLRRVAEHPRADRAVLLAGLGQVTTLLTGAARPYAAALALARRPELEPAEVRRLTRLPGASRRMARGVERALAQRP